MLDNLYRQLAADVAKLVTLHEAADEAYADIMSNSTPKMIAAAHWLNDIRSARKQTIANVQATLAAIEEAETKRQEGR